MVIKNNVAVIMSVYKEPVSVLSLAVESILSQTFKRIKLIIVVDDPKNIEAIDFLKEKAKKDNRIEVFLNDKNMGLPYCLNRGIDLASGSKYIARMDADDISVPDRLKKQYDFLEKHQEIDLIGCGVYFIDENERIVGKRNVTLLDEKSFRKAMGLVNIMSHPTFFGRTEIFEKYKYRNLRYAQDYDFVCRVLEGGSRVINLGEYLLYYRKDSGVKNDDKSAIQFMTQFFVRYYFSRGELNDTNVLKHICSCVNNTKEYRNVKKAVKNYNKSMALLKRKNIAGVFFMVIAIFGSKYCMDRFCKTLKYVILCKKCTKNKKGKKTCLR